MRALHHRREINKKTRAGDRKLRKQLRNAQKVGFSQVLLPYIPYCFE